MAIYHFSLRIVSRSAGKSAVAMAAYRSGDRLYDERTGETKFYPRDVQPETMILAPEDAPDWVYDRNRLWNEVEKSERRKDAQLCREIDIALPVELTPEQQTELMKQYVQEQFVDRGMIADMAIYRDNPKNPYAFVMLTMRRLNPDGTWMAKARKEYKLDDNGQRIKLPSGSFASVRINLTDWNQIKTLMIWREAWAKHANWALEKAGSPARIDHRSLADQGITDRLPTVHEGAARNMERRGVQSDRGELNRTVQEYNELAKTL